MHILQTRFLSLEVMFQLCNTNTVQILLRISVKLKTVVYLHFYTFSNNVFIATAHTFWNLSSLLHLPGYQCKGGCLNCDFDLIVTEVITVNLGYNGCQGESKNCPL
jgi:hypothetical protein